MTDIAKIKTCGQYNWAIKSVQRDFFVIERTDNLGDIRRISLKGWEQFSFVGPEETI